MPACRSNFIKIGHYHDDVSILTTVTTIFEGFAFYLVEITKFKYERKTKWTLAQ